MARVVALVPDLLFGSKVHAALAAAGHEVMLTGDERTPRAQAPGADVLVVDLATGTIDGATLVESMRAGGELGVDADARLLQPRRRRGARAGARAPASTSSCRARG